MVCLNRKIVSREKFSTLYLLIPFMEGGNFCILALEKSFENTRLFTKLFTNI